MHDAFVVKGFQNWKQKQKEKLGEHVGGPNSTHNRAWRNCQALMNEQQHFRTFVNRQTNQARNDYWMHLNVSIDCVGFLLMQEKVAGYRHPSEVPLFHVYLWLQVHGLRIGFMLARCAQRIGNDVVNLPLHRGTRLKQEGDEWFSVTFCYKRLSTYCFICGLLGHGERFYLKLVEWSEVPLQRLYGPELCAISRRSQTNIGVKWLREEPLSVEEMEAVSGQVAQFGNRESFGPKNSLILNGIGGIRGDNSGGDHVSNLGGCSNLNLMPFKDNADGVVLIDPKRKRLGLDQASNMAHTTNSSEKGGTDAKNLTSAGTGHQARRKK
ncbi:hypothetical protein GH714_027321 [Hevea brasiliensis]|uniref:Uncharacterized protein n=1 Tax=Hevea brasiliensis TaxID=3981 RepID=A0A6A6K878_HEVBR|nr:hypothetical protein GH714_027321 [Hevea brasiliensis]